MADGNKQLAPQRNACPIAAVLHAGNHIFLPCHGQLEGDDVALGSPERRLHWRAAFSSGEAMSRLLSAICAISS